MRKIIILLSLIMFSINSFGQNYELILEDIKKNIDSPEYAIKIGQHLHNNKNNIKDIKESLRHASIINRDKRDSIIKFAENAGIVDKVEINEWISQSNTYADIVNQLRRSVSDIDKEISYSSYRCNGVENLIYSPNAINQFQRNLKISDVSANQDFIRFKNKEDYKIVHIPNPESVINHISFKENIKFSLIEEKFIFNNATSVSMYNKVSLNNKVYYMFPYNMYTYPSNNLEELTAYEYGWFALNLKLVGRFTPEILNTYKKLFKRNASLCLYSK